MVPSSLPSLGPCFLCVAAAAQVPYLDLPRHAGLADANQAHYAPFGFAGQRSQLLIEAAAVASSPSVVTGLRFRADRPLGALAAITWPNVTVRMSHSAVPLASMATSFASNETEVPQTVFQGAVTLPARTPVTSGAEPWNVVVAFPNGFLFDPSQGNLLLDLVVDGVSALPEIGWLDAAEPGGGFTSFGHPGDHPQFDTMTLRVDTGVVFDSLRIAPGNTIEFRAIRQFSAAPGVLVLATSPLPQSVDLTPLGAPGNELFVAPEAIVPLSTWTLGLFGVETTLPLSVPNQPSLLGVVVRGQAIVIDPTANALGLLTSDAVEVRIGDAAEVLPARQLDGPPPPATAGFLLDFGATQPRYGMLAVRLEGAFF